MKNLGADDYEEDKIPETEGLLSGIKALKRIKEEINWLRRNASLLLLMLLQSSQPIYLCYVCMCDY